MEGLAMREAFWRDRPTFVTGATGLVGSRVVRRLLTLGADAVCLVRDHVPLSDLARSGDLGRVKVVQGDVRDQALIERVLGEYEMRSVIHLAAQTIVGVANRNPVSTFDSNVRGTWTVLEACRRSPTVKEIVVASSDKAYGEHERLPYQEDTPLKGSHPYDVSKSCADLIAAAYFRTYGLPVVITRCGNFYGGGDLNWNRIVPGTIRSVLRGERPLLRSDGRATRDYLYVEDGADAYLAVAQALADKPEIAGEAFNFSNERPVTALEMVRTILRLMGSELEPDIRNQATNEIPHQTLDATKARRVLGWTPSFTLETGLPPTIAWYRHHLADE
ncbi:MAG: GDP-mannose 4,6-dehydratase [Deltaproteobacteria bacterium]|nr:GDP-mannose 4,6-dehydratase [Deltaproteobacteria bacterium]